MFFLPNNFVFPPLNVCSVGGKMFSVGGDNCSVGEKLFSVGGKTSSSGGNNCSLRGNVSSLGGNYVSLRGNNCLLGGNLPVPGAESDRVWRLGPDSGRAEFHQLGILRPYLFLLRPPLLILRPNLFLICYNVRIFRFQGEFSCTPRGGKALKALTPPMKKAGAWSTGFRNGAGERSSSFLLGAAKPWSPGTVSSRFRIGAGERNTPPRSRDPEVLRAPGKRWSESARRPGAVERSTHETATPPRVGNGTRVQNK